MTAKSRLALLCLLVCQMALPQKEEGSVCIAPVVREAVLFNSDPNNACDADRIRVKVGVGPVNRRPRKGSLKISNLDPNGTHQVVISCGSKRAQSFKFRFSDFKTKHLCLFLNDLYGWVQIWEDNHAPWCKCLK